MKKRKMMALLTAAAVMCSLAVPALADEAEGDLIPITFCRTADPLVEANVFANMEGRLTRRTSGQILLRRN